LTPWDELGAGVFRRRYARFDQNVGVVIGTDSACVIDSRATHADADQLRAELAPLTSIPVRWLVNTHMHWDHTFGNARFPEAVIVGHRMCRLRLVEDGEGMRQRLLAAPWITEDDRPAFREVEIVPPSLTFETSIRIHLGDRTLDVTHLGRGHTDNDVVVTVGDVCFAGDLVEEGAPPSFSDAYPDEWVATLDVLAPMAPATIVPGHGDVVDPAHVRSQREAIAAAVAHLRTGDGPAPWSRAVMDSIGARLDTP